MKKTLLICAASAALAAAAATATLTRAEKMTPTEIAALRACEREVADAQRDLDAVKLAIAKAHGIEPQSWMEWAITLRIDGDFILETYHNYMR